ncbi:MAG: tripartite tricarboxylate transporter substrate binding protein [Variibacter sp.]|nr:tripartite tricarboxylate transporter substrate binding protein [Variibacter sp.]
MRGRITRRAFALAGVAGAAALGLRGTAALGQGDYPTKPIRIIIPFGPGGSSDISARVLQSHLQQLLGQPLIVEHRPGAGSNIGTAAVARSDPDGYTLLITSSAFVVNPTLYAKVPYDPYKQFAPIADIADAPNVLVATPQSGLKSLADVIARAKAEPGKLNGATPGIGTTPHLSFELLKQRAGLDIVLVPYPGGGPAAQAVLSGTTDLFFTAMPNIYGQLQSGALKALAIASDRRWPDLPDVPTFIESGFPNFVTSTGHLFLAPAGTPPAIVKKLSDATVQVLKRPEIVEQFLKLGYFTVAGDAETAQARIARDVPFYGEIIAKAKLRIE